MGRKRAVALLIGIVALGVATWMLLPREPFSFLDGHALVFSGSGMTVYSFKGDFEQVEKQAERELKAAGFMPVGGLDLRSRFVEPVRGQGKSAREQRSVILCAGAWLKGSGGLLNYRPGWVTIVLDGDYPWWQRVLRGMGL